MKQCCAGLGVARALDDFAMGVLPPLIPGLRCDMDYNWDTYFGRSKQPVDSLPVGDSLVALWHGGRISEERDA